MNKIVELNKLETACVCGGGKTFFTDIISILGLSLSKKESTRKPLPIL